MFNDYSITLYNFFNNSYYRTELNQVDWQCRTSNVAGNNGITKSNEIKIFIDKPLNNYLKPRDYRKEDNKELYFTFKAGDIIVKDIIDFKFDEKNTLKILRKEYDDVVTITTIKEYDDHFELICE